MNQKAFTLIELLVVVAIIGILAAVGVVAYNGYTKAAKIKATLHHHSVAVKYIQSVLSLCETGGTHGYTNIKGAWINYTCDNNDGLITPLVQYLILNSGFKNPYRTNVYGAWQGSLLPKGWGQDLEVKYRAMERNGKLSSGFICCHTLGHVSIERSSICKGKCCFLISTAYDVDANGNGIVKMDTVSGDSCTR